MQVPGHYEAWNPALTQPSPEANRKLKPRELKQILVQEGFQIYRVLGSQVILADRVRENLIMDSGVCAVCSDTHRIRFVVRAQAADYPEENEEQLLERARRLAQPGIEQGYAEVETAVVPVSDPVDDTRTLDTWYEVRFEKEASDLDDLFQQLRTALGFDKVA
jgi:hypothetical protein